MVLGDIRTECAIGTVLVGEEVGVVGWFLIVYPPTYRTFTHK